MFAGVGGFRAGLTRVGGFQCVGHCEIDKYAEASYRAIHDIREEERYYEQALNIISEYVETELTPPPIHQKSNKKKARDAHER